METQEIKAEKMLTAESWQVTSSTRRLKVAINDRWCGLIQKQEVKTRGRERTKALMWCPAWDRMTHEKLPSKYNCLNEVQGGWFLKDAMFMCRYPYAVGRALVLELESSGLQAFPLNLTWFTFNTFKMDIIIPPSQSGCKIKWNEAPSTVTRPERVFKKCVESFFPQQTRSLV